MKMKTIIIGLDAFDPKMFERLHAEGKLPHLGKIADQGGYSRFEVASPPQSEVSWTSIATGEDPGTHGIFDFVHRNPKNYALEVSLLPTKKSAVGLQFVPPHRARTLFDAAVQDGFPATSLWWPATFPAKLESPVRTIPGLGAPDIQGRLGIGTLFSTGPIENGSDLKTSLKGFERAGDGRWVGALEGPMRKTRKGSEPARAEFVLEKPVHGGVSLMLGEITTDLEPGKWSPILEIPFKVGFGITIKAITRAILTSNAAETRLYFLPLQIHPLHSAWPYGASKGFVKELWKSCGPFLSLGWPQDTTALEEGCIDDAQFLALCDLVFEERQRVFFYLMDKFQEGVLACVFDTLDRVQHMFWQRSPELVEGWYRKLDDFIGRVSERLGEDTQLIVLSDHGFGPLDYKVHLNRWLIENGYLKKKMGHDEKSLMGVEWAQTTAYAIGLNSLYLNLIDREGQGVVKAEDRPALLEGITERLLGWQGPDGVNVVQRVLRREEVFHGPLAEYGPDLVIGYTPGYRASARTGLGEWGDEQVEPNRAHWEADHCFDASAVPGVLFTNQSLEGMHSISYRDIPQLALGKGFKSKASSKPAHSDEAQEAVMQRLKDLGYL